MHKINVAIADDHDLVRKGLVSLLEDDDNINVAFDVSNGRELLSKIRRKSVDVVILDLEMPELNGKETLKKLTYSYPKVKVIILSMHNSNEYILDCMSHGAKAYLPKNSDIEKLVEAIYQVHKTGFYADSDVSKLILDHALKLKNNIQNPDDKLSSREIEVTQLICEGLLNKEIADKLCLSIRTIEVHRQNIIRKTNVNNVAGLIKYAVEKGYYKHKP